MEMEMNLPSVKKLSPGTIKTLQETLSAILEARELTGEGEISIPSTNERQKALKYLYENVLLKPFPSVMSVTAEFRLELTPEDLQLLIKFNNLINSHVRQYKPTEWGWYNKKRNIYQFGKKVFQQEGKIRGKVFRALMDIWEKSPQAISIPTLREMTNLKPRRLRIEIAAINTRLRSISGLYFKGSGKGYYTLKKVSKNS